LLACVLRPSSRDPASVFSALIKLIVRQLRQHWPHTRIVVRADSGFCRPQALRRLDKWGVHYIIGLQKNVLLQQWVQMAELMLAEQYEASGVKQRLIGEFSYAARSWDKPRRVIARLEYGALGANPRFVVTSLQGEAAELYEQLYCARGEAENRIKEAQLDLFGRRASCHKYQANQLRLLLAALAYTLRSTCAAWRCAAPSWNAHAPPPSAPSCSRSERLWCATRAACGCCWRRTIR
jgi:hypothetical protein